MESRQQSHDPAQMVAFWLFHSVKVATGQQYLAIEQCILMVLLLLKQVVLVPHDRYHSNESNGALSTTLK